MPLAGVHNQHVEEQQLTVLRHEEDGAEHALHHQQSQHQHQKGENHRCDSRCPGEGLHILSLKDFPGCLEGGELSHYMDRGSPDS
jgi:hypothetical protein